ncbi:MAG TPA: hypothetical protein PLC04_04790 [Candidatus Kapabacteria bacterium]|jgi:shikimate dehydrogenase|nr:hypothetical protein [Candidatus Kapabacteria bacterium]HOV92380.1 hypothetical protein [Candidatus Kapabacteria bacterium]
MLKLGIAGNPVFHSKSKELFKLISKKNNIELKYLPISTFNSKSIIDFSKNFNLNGINITNPLKQSIMELLSKIDYQASNLNSVNTILFNNESMIGYNTDYFGILQTIWDNNLIFNKKKVVILGSGSAARTAAFAIRNLNANIFIWDRIEEKAKKVAEDLVVSYINDKNLIQKINEFDYIISTIPPNSKILRELKFEPHQIIIDTIYNNSYFYDKQKLYNYHFISGYNWLINQVLLSFEMFTGIHSKKEEVINEFDNYLNTKNDNFIFVGSFTDKINELLNHLASELNFKIIDTSEKFNDLIIPQGNLIHTFTNILDRILNEIHTSNDKYLIKFNNPLFYEPDILEMAKKIGEIIWLYDPLLDNNSNNELFFNNSDYSFILSEDIEESKERIVSELERII